MSPNPLLARIRDRGFAVLDGALGTELEARGHDLSDALWSARVLRKEPAAITAIHRDYLDAGADCIVSASYQATLDGFERAGIERAEGRALLKRSVALAREARGERSALVAASVGPYGGALADGSEFTGDYDLDEDGLVEWHRERFAILAGAGADLLACETIPSFAEARALTRLLDETPGSWAWFSFACRDAEHISDGTPLRACFELLEAHDRVAAVGVNCTAPHLITDLLRAAGPVTSKPIVVYPNSGQTWDAEAKGWVGEHDACDFAEAAVEWRALGARLIGGCCQTRPASIQRLRERLGS